MELGGGPSKLQASAEMGRGLAVPAAKWLVG